MAVGRIAPIFDKIVAGLTVLDKRRSVGVM